MRAALRGSIVTLLITVTIALATASPSADAQTTTAPPATSAVGTTVPPTAAVATGDTASSRTVNRIVLALLSLAGLLLVLTLWLWRSTKPKPAHLDALDAMGSRRWQRASTAARTAMLAPVHERRGEIRDEDLIAEPEPVEEPAALDIPAPAMLESPAPAGLEPAAPEPEVGAEVVPEVVADEGTEPVGADAVATGPTVERHG